MSASTVSHVERSQRRGVSIELLTKLFAVVGMRLSARPYPAGPPLRDAAHARLLARFRERLSPVLASRTEVPLRVSSSSRTWGDLRAWDGEIESTAGSCKLEAETALRDLQATERRIALKMADDGVDRVVLLVADTKRNRRVLREFRGSIVARFPLDTRTVMRELGAGRIPARSGIAVL